MLANTSKRLIAATNKASQYRQQAGWSRKLAAALGVRATRKQR